MVYLLKDFGILHTFGDTLCIDNSEFSNLFGLGNQYVKYIYKMSFGLLNILGVILRTVHLAV